jgi:hypothetical protein
VEYAGAIYHVTVRRVGHAWESGHGLNPAVCLFRDDAERERFVELVGRYKAKPVEGDAYHLALSRYVHLNPIRTRAAQERALEERQDLLRTYRWSSYRAYVGKATAPEWLT